MDELTESEFVAWLQDATTRKVIKMNEKKIADIQENLGTGGTLDHSSAIVTLANTSESVGKIDGLKKSFELELF